MRQPDKGWELTIWISWQRLVAALLVLAGLLVLGFGLVRPMLSAYIGQRVSREMNAALAREVLAALVGPTAPVAAEQAAPAAPAVAQAPAATGEVAAPPSAAQPAPPPGAAPTGAAAAQPPPPAAEQAGAPQALERGGLLRAIAEAAPATPEPAASAAPATAQPGAAPAATAAQPAAGDPAARPAPPAIPTPVVAAPISAPNDGRSVEQVVAALPSGVITVTEEKVNAKVAARAAALGPIDRIVVRFTPGRLQVTLTVLGQDTVATAGLALSGGRVVAQDPQLSGALSVVLSVADLVRPVEDELNAIVAAAGREVRGVAIEQGQIVVTMD